MLKDVNGFLWIGTRFGSNRFDGSTFKNYFAGKNNKKAIIGDQIEKLIEDSLHNIWIGTNNGLSRYDSKADTFTNFFQASPFWATHDEVLCIEHSPNNIYAATQVIAYNNYIHLQKNTGKIYRKG